MNVLMDNGFSTATLIYFLNKIFNKMLGLSNSSLLFFIAQFFG